MLRMLAFRPQTAGMSTAVPSGKRAEPPVPAGRRPARSRGEYTVPARSAGGTPARGA